MQINSPSLFIEINKFQFIFAVIDNKDNDTLKVLEIISTPIQGFNDCKISDLDLVQKIFKKNIYSLEQKLNIVFKEATIIISNFNCSVINLSGYKKLNGSQLVKENITYIINSLKSKIIEVEDNKRILHIFNSKFLIDKTETENLPIGLFGNFYSHELSFFLINNNDYKNLKNILNECNLRVKKILSKKFLEGVDIINNNLNEGNFFKIKINKDYSEITFFENSSLKFIQNFKFGSDLVINDISKVVALNKSTVEKILLHLNLYKDNLTGDYIEKEFFVNQNFRKIKKELITDIAKARIKELAEILILKNINILNYLQKKNKIFLKISDELNFKYFKENYKYYFSDKSKINLEFLSENNKENIFKNAYNLVQYGWKKEAVPIVLEKRSLITRFFDKIFK